MDTLWLPEDAGGLDGAVLLAGLVGSVRVPHLGLALGPMHPGWPNRARTLQLLSRGRLVLSAPAAALPERAPAPVLAEGGPATPGIAGIVHPLGFADVRSRVLAAPNHEHWIEGRGSEGRAAWRALRDTATTAGATGIIVAHSPLLLDLLRNPDDEDDRSDLQMATG